MEFATTRVGAEMVVTMPGPRLDAAAAPQVRSGLIGLIDAGETALILDLGDVDFLDSSGLGALVGCYKHLGGEGSLQIARPRPAVSKVLALTRMDRVFRIRDELPVA